MPYLSHPAHVDEHKKRVSQLTTLGVPATWDDLAQSGNPSGMHNFGAVCYRRVALQTLLNLPRFTTYLSTSSHSPATLQGCSFQGPQCFSCALYNLSLHYWGAGRPVLSQKDLHRLDRAVNARTHEFLPMSRQCDSYDFLRWIIDALESRASGLRPTLSKALFATEYHTKWHCSDCNAIHSTQSENWHILSLPVTHPKPNLPLSRYLSQYFIDTASIRCDVPPCAGKYPNRADKPLATYDEPCVRNRRSEIVALPEYLIIQLQSSDSTGMRKIASYPRYRLWLHMSQFQANGALREGNPVRYRLHSVVYHIGTSTTSGHYAGVFTTPSGVFEIDDAIVREANVKDLFWRKEQGRGTPYLLAYVRCTGA